MTELKQNILTQIEQKKIKPKPKWLFAFKAFGLATGVVFIILFAFYILAFLGFVMSERDWIQESTYSLSGLYFLFNTLPLTMIFLASVMIIVAALTAYKYGLSYKKPFIYTFIGIIIILFASRYIFVMSGLQTYIKEEAFKEHIQLVPTAWKNLRENIKSAQMK